MRNISSKWVFKVSPGPSWRMSGIGHGTFCTKSRSFPSKCAGQPRPVQIPVQWCGGSSPGCSAPCTGIVQAGGPHICPLALRKAHAIGVLAPAQLYGWHKSLCTNVGGSGLKGGYNAICITAVIPCCSWARSAHPSLPLLPSCHLLHSSPFSPYPSSTPPLLSVEAYRTQQALVPLLARVGQCGPLC